MSTVEEPVSARPPTAGEYAANGAFRWSCYGFGALVVVLLAYIVLEIFRLGWPAMQERGLAFVVGTVWDPNRNEFGILPEIWGTLYSSLLGILIGSVLGVAVAIFLAEGFVAAGVFWVLSRFGLQYTRLWSHFPEQVETFVKTLIQLLAAIPSVVYGLWGIFVVIPAIRPMCNWIHEGLSGIPFFSTALSGPGILPAAIVLAIMVLPIITSISYEALVAVPPKIREASFGLGATRWETILGVLLPTAAPGIFGAILLAFGRALGETMALAMLVGNSNTLSLSLFSPANTIAALLANNFGEAGDREVSLLMYAALVLLIITLVVNILGSLVLQKLVVKEGKR
ncbi:MAG: phosphate ABC transporter permease subunit PstC [Gemmataceae bacterium]|nr:phosphate ABC transporter permease subunit PstC [Gemmataceae bacterium]